MVNPRNNDEPRKLTTADLDPRPKVVEYDEDSDTLWIGNGDPVPNGMQMFDGCVVFSNVDRLINGIMIDNARDLLLGVLMGEGEKDGDAQSIPVSRNGDEAASRGC